MGSKYRKIRWKQGSISYLIDIKSTTKIIIFFFLTLSLLIISTGIGDMNIHPVNVVKVFLGQGTEMESLVVTSFRLPRILISVLAGICLAASGAILQGIIRNPLASPDMIGITGGAAVAVVSFLALFSDSNNALTVSVKWMPVAAFIGAAAIGMIIYALAWKNGVSPIRLVLIGVGFMSLTKALTTLFMILGPIYNASQANRWITGTVNGSNWENVRILLPVTVVLFGLSLIVARKLNVQELGDELAKGAGSSVEKDRLFLLLLSTALAGGAVAFAGGIGFVGLMAPHIGRRLVGSSFGALIPISACIGAILVLVADLIGRTMFTPLEVPAGVFTAAIGAPYFIYLLFKNKNM